MENEYEDAHNKALKKVEDIVRRCVQALPGAKTLLTREIRKEHTEAVMYLRSKFDDLIRTGVKELSDKIKEYENKVQELEQEQEGYKAERQKQDARATELTQKIEELTRWAEASEGELKRTALYHKALLKIYQEIPEEITRSKEDKSAKTQV